MSRVAMNRDWVARHLDMWIGIYFSNQTSRQTLTLGEFLADTLPEIGNIEAMKWLAGDRPTGEAVEG